MSVELAVLPEDMVVMVSELSPVDFVSDELI
jgi:hypothetical protein